MESCMVGDPVFHRHNFQFIKCVFFFFFFFFDS